MDRVDDAFVHAPPTAGARLSGGDGSAVVNGGKSVDCKTTGTNGWEGECRLGAPFRAGDPRELFTEESWCRGCAECRVGWGFKPTAQSGRAGSGCCEEAVDVYVRRDDEEVVEDDYARQVSHC